MSNGMPLTELEKEHGFGGYGVEVARDIVHIEMYDAATGMLVYRSKMHATFKRKLQLVPGGRWLE